MVGNYMLWGSHPIVPDVRMVIKKTNPLSQDGEEVTLFQQSANSPSGSSFALTGLIKKGPSLSLSCLMVTIIFALLRIIPPFAFEAATWALPRF